MTSINVMKFASYEEIKDELCTQWRVIYTCEGQDNADDCNMDEICKTQEPLFQVRRNISN